MVLLASVLANKVVLVQNSSAGFGTQLKKIILAQLPLAFWLILVKGGARTHQGHLEFHEWGLKFFSPHRLEQLKMIL